MKYLKPKIVFQEVPDETALVFPISGCPRQCPGCHSPDLQSQETGALLTSQIYQDYLTRYQEFVTCICFFGGDQEAATLVPFLRLARQHKLKTCLYTGACLVPPEIHQELDYLKTGPWIASLGGLDSPGTNQKFVDLLTGKVLNHRFWNHHATK